MAKKVERRPLSIAPFIIWPLVLIIGTLSGLFLYVYSKRSVARIVGDFPITERMINVEIRNLEMFGYKAPTNATATELKEFGDTARNKALSNLTDFLVVIQKAKETHQDEVTGKEIDDRIQLIMQDTGVNKIEEYLAEAQETEGELRTQVRNQLIYERMTMPIRDQVAEPSDQELEEYFNQIRDTYYMIPESVDYEQIVVPDLKTHDEVIKKLAQAKGKNFAEMAKEYSTDIASRDRGGKMTQITKDAIPEVEVQNAIFPPSPNYPAALEVGIIQGVQTQKGGIYIVNIIKRNPPQTGTFNGKLRLFNGQTQKYEDFVIKPDVIRLWKTDRGNAAVSAYVKRLSDYYESRIYDRVKGNMPWGGLERFFAGLLGQTLYNKIMGAQ